MRIRKREVPLALSSLSPVPIWSDPNLSRPTMVQLKLDQNPHRNLSLIADAASYFDPQPSDQPSQPIGGGSTDLVDPAGAFQAVKALMEEEDRRRGEAGERKSNDSRKEDVLGTEIETTVLKQPSSSHQAGGRWFEGEKAFPLKKRRGSVERRSSDEMVMEKDKKMKTKANKQCEQQNGAEQAEIKETKEDVIHVSTSSAIKRARGGALMEGSRCSRVNGRGWRCCQQTLVGYSLCEHHLGKGRLRSMNNVRRPKANNSTTRATLKKANSQPLSSLGNYSSSLEDQETKPKALDHTVNGGNEGEDHEKKPLVIMKKKKMKLGTVKARSLSSLLGLANEAISMAENEN